MDPLYVHFTKYRQAYGILATGVLMVVLMVAPFQPIEMLKANILFAMQDKGVQVLSMEQAEKVLEDSGLCYHKVENESEMAICTELGCVYPDRSFCIADLCYTGEGEPIAYDQAYFQTHKIDATCIKKETQKKDEIARVNQKEGQEAVVASRIKEYNQILGKSWQKYNHYQKGVQQKFPNINVERSAVKELLKEWRRELSRMDVVLKQGRIKTFLELEEGLKILTSKTDRAYETFIKEGEYKEVGVKIQQKKRNLVEIESRIAGVQNGEDPAMAKELQQKLEQFKFRINNAESLYKKVLNEEMEKGERSYDIDYEVDTLEEAEEALKSFKERAATHQEGVRGAEAAMEEMRRDLPNKQKILNDYRRSKKELGEMPALMNEIKKNLKEMQDLTKTEPFEAERFWGLAEAIEKMENRFWDQAES